MARMRASPSRRDSPTPTSASQLVGEAPEAESVASVFEPENWERASLSVGDTPTGTSERSIGLAKILVDLKVERWPVEKLLPYARNARLHSAAQVDQIAASMREYGFNHPCSVDADGVLIAGHGRLLAAKQIGLSEAPVIRLGHLTPEQVRAFRIADNKLALNSEWDLTLLATELEGLPADLIGFSQDELKLISSGWDTDLTDILKHGDAVDGIVASIRVTCRLGDQDAVREAILDALKGFEGVSVG